MGRGVGWKSVLAVASAFAGIAAISPASGAIANEANAACLITDDQSTYRFVAPFPPTAQRATIVEGFEKIEDVIDYNGVSTVTMTEVFNTGGDVLVRWQDITDADVLGTADCATSTIVMDVGPTGNLLRKVATHEMLHMLGLRHTGQDYGFNDPNNENRRSNDNPTLSNVAARSSQMATCQSETSNINIGMLNTPLSTDDAANLARLHTSLSRPSINANPGFETGRRYWGITPFQNVSWDLINGGSKSGAKHVRFRSNDSSNQQALVQTVNFDLAHGDVLRVFGATKLWNPTDEGNVSVEIWARVVQYAADGSECVWPTGRNENDRTSSAIFLQRSWKTVPVESDWENFHGAEWTVPNALERMDVQVRLTTDLQNSSGANASVRIDNLRIECESFSATECN